MARLHLHRRPAYPVTEGREFRALTNRTSQQDLRSVLIRLNQIMRGWANYFKHAVCKHTLGNLAHFAWWRVIRWLRTLHRGRWKDVRRALTTPEGRWKPITADGIELLDLQTVPITRYRYRGSKKSPAPGSPTTPDGRNRGEPGAQKWARRVRRAAWGNGPGAIRAPRPRPTQPSRRSGRPDGSDGVATGDTDLGVLESAPLRRGAHCRRSARPRAVMTPPAEGADQRCPVRWSVGAPTRVG